MEELTVPSHDVRDSEQYDESQEESEAESADMGDEDIVGSEDETDEDEDQPVLASVEMTLNQFTDRVIDKQMAFNWDHEELIWSNYPKIDQPAESNRKNILHVLIERYQLLPPDSEKEAIRAIREAVGKIILKFPELLKGKDIQEKTPLICALMSKKKHLISEILNASTVENDKKKTKKRPLLSQAIPIKCNTGSRQENALHYALNDGFSGLDPKIVRKLVRFAPRAAIACADSEGFTPLHYAVDYRKGSDLQVKNVSSLLSRGDVEGDDDKAAVLDFLTKKEGLSVYQYLLYTRERYQEQASIEKMNKQISSRAIPSKQAKDRDREEQARQARLRDIEQKASDDPRGLQAKGGRDLPPIATDQWRLGSVKDNLAQNTPKRNKEEGFDHSALQTSRALDSKTATSNSGAKRSTHAEKKGKTSTKPEKSPEQRRKELDDWHNQIRLEIKLQYLRTRTHQQATSLLFGAEPQRKHRDPRQLCRLPMPALEIINTDMTQRPKFVLSLEIFDKRYSRTISSTDLIQSNMMKF